MYCPSCGKKIIEDSKYCKHCGYSLTNTSSELSENKTVDKNNNRGKKNYFSIFFITLISVAFVAVSVILTFYILNNINKIEPVEADNEVIETKTIDTETIVDDSSDAQQNEIDENTSEENSILPKEDLSQKQQELVTFLGYPDEFLVIFDEGNNNARVEDWIYAGIERYFIFNNGDYEGGDYIILEDIIDDNLEIKPEDFTFGLSSKQVGAILGEEDEIIVDTNTGLKIINYAGGLVICTFNSDDKLINVSRKKDKI
ncbi:MAG: zinc-ribbon domain-containing protein [Actinomycetia bacterium]|nr:zinc-ribbon domain-containing protein [Actinomycetes bacterium]